MKYLKGLLFISFVLFLVSCTANAKNDGKVAKVEAGSEGEVILLNKQDFLKKVFNYEQNSKEWRYEGSKPCIVDFYADWCGPCRQVAPILKDLAGIYKNDIIIYKVNVDNDKELASTFGIQGIPSCLFVPAKGQPQMATGALSRSEYIKVIETFLLERTSTEK